MREVDALLVWLSDRHLTENFILAGNNDTDEITRNILIVKFLLSYIFKAMSMSFCGIEGRPPDSIGINVPPVSETNVPPSAERNVPLVTIDHAIRFLKPDYIIMVGIGFALKEDKLKLGDVMIASEIEDYGSLKIQDNTIIERGSRVQADKTLLDRFTNAIVNWNGVPVRFGLVVTNDVLVDDKVYVEELQNRFPDAIGGEMEGCGLLANYQTPWILVKAVCDYGYNKGDDYQGDAAMNAIQYVDYVLREFDL